MATDKSKEAMKLALETLEVWKGYMPALWDKTDEKAIIALREALAEQPAQQQEPVGEITAEDMGRPFNAIRIGTHFYKEVPPVGTKLYTSPPAQRTWVGLTDEETYRHCPNWLSQADFKALMLHIEAKLKEKNS